VTTVGPEQVWRRSSPDVLAPASDAADEGERDHSLTLLLLCGHGAGMRSQMRQARMP
jgi:hypothetical protein